LWSDENAPANLLAPEAVEPVKVHDRDTMYTLIREYSLEYIENHTQIESSFYVDRITNCPPVVQYSIEFGPFRPAYHFLDVKDWNTSQLGTTGGVRLRKRL